MLLQSQKAALLREIEVNAPQILAKKGRKIVQDTINQSTDIPSLISSAGRLGLTESQAKTALHEYMPREMSGQQKANQLESSKQAILAEMKLREPDQYTKHRGRAINFINEAQDLDNLKRIAGHLGLNEAQINESLREYMPSEQGDSVFGDSVNYDTKRQTTSSRPYKYDAMRGKSTNIPDTRKQSARDDVSSVTESVPGSVDLDEYPSANIQRKVKDILSGKQSRSSQNPTSSTNAGKEASSYAYEPSESYGYGMAPKTSTKKSEPLRSGSPIGKRLSSAPVQTIERSKTPALEREKTPARVRVSSPIVDAVRSDIKGMGGEKVLEEIRSRAITPSQRRIDEATNEFIKHERSASAPVRSRKGNKIKIHIPTAAEEEIFKYDNDAQNKIWNAQRKAHKARPEIAPSAIHETSDQQRKIAELAFKELNTPYQEFGEDPIAKLEPNQKLYRELLDLNSPYSDEAIEQRNRTNEALYPYLTDRTGSEIAAPYLNELSKNPADMHEDLMGDVEREHFQSIRDEAAQTFNEDILPGIRAKYQVPGLRQHGHMGRDIGRASEKFGKGLGSAIAQSKADFRGLTLGAAQKHAALLGKAAETHSHAAEKDRANNLTAFGALHNIRRGENAEKSDHAMKTNMLGVADSQRTQDRLNQQKIAFEEARDARMNKLTKVSDIINKYQLNQPVAAPKRPEASAGSTEQALATAMATGAGRMMGWNQPQQPQQQQQQHKKGGRVHKAFGGIVNPAETAIQNAVVQKSDPIYELRRLMNLPEPDVQKYAEGGQVNPITAGAQEAQQYAGHAAMQKKLQRMRQPVQDPGFMGNMMNAMGSQGDNKGWLANAFRGAHAGYSSVQQQREASKKQVDAADELEYKLQNDIEAKKREDRKLAIQEKLANAKLAKYKQQMDPYSGLDKDERPTKKQTPSDLASIEKAKHRFSKILAYKEANEEIEELAPKVDSGPMQDLFGNVTSYITPMFGKGSREERLKLKDAGANVVNAYTAMQDAGGGRSVAHLNQKKEDKPGLNKLPSHNTNKSGKSADAATEDLMIEIGIMKERGASKKELNEFIAKASRKKPIANEIIKVNKPLSEMTEQEIKDKLKNKG